MTNKDQTKVEQTYIKKRVYNRVIELYVWVILALLVVFPALYYSLRNGIYDDFLLEFYNQFLLGVLFILIPILFKLIFGKLPLEYLRNKREGVQEIKFQDSHNINVIVNQQTNDEQLETYNIQCINESKAIAERVFTRSGVYLLVGCLIAFIGVAIFYSPIFQQTNSTDITQRLLDYLPRFGALFFIEFIALFFLKQYRIMLEEYRYYEAIKRKRQDNLNLIELIETHKDNFELLKLLTENISQNVITKLSNGETTEILESQKIVNQDMDIFSKFTDLIKEIKNK
jgi:hypothetical protein